jgi:phosphoglycerate kinase
LLQQLPTIDSFGDLTGKRVLVRVDFNVPLRVRSDGTREVVDDFRIRAALPLFRTLQERGAQVVACTHLGRPDGQPDERFSVAPVREHLASLIDGVDLLENLRFHPGEEANDPSFGASLVKGIDFYVNEAFGASHRAHASVMIPPTLVPAAAGPNLHHEVSTLLGILENPQRPFVAIVGGAKVADKIGITEVLAKKADRVLVGGGMMFTFWQALGRRIGSSLVDPTRIDDCKALLQAGNIAVPTDVLTLPVGAPFGRGGDQEPELGDDVPDGAVGLDIGPRSVRHFADIIEQAGTVLWNGPMGVFEDPRFCSGTEGVAQAVAKCRGTSVIGGGDSAAAIDAFGLAEHVSFISTGGGASLELLEFGDLPGLRALRQAER